MCNTREENAADLAQEAAMPVLPITRAELIDKLVEYRSDDWDRYDIANVLRCGRIGFEELSNDALEQIALDYMLCDENMNEVRYTITDADTSKPSVEEINAALLAALKETIDVTTVYHRNEATGRPWLTNALAAIALAEGRS